MRVDPIVLGEGLTVWAAKAVIRPPAIPLVLHQEDETAASVSEVAESSLGIFVLSSPPGKEVAAEG